MSAELEEQEIKRREQGYETQFECGCTTWLNSYISKISIHHCPLHQAADGLLKGIEAQLRNSLRSTGDDPDNWKLTITSRTLELAIKQAESKGETS